MGNRSATVRTKHKRIAKWRRAKLLAAHHRLCMKLAAAGATSFPKPPPKPR